MITGARAAVQDGKIGYDGLWRVESESGTV